MELSLVTLTEFGYGLTVPTRALVEHLTGQDLSSFAVAYLTVILDRVTPKPLSINICPDYKTPFTHVFVQELQEVKELMTYLGPLAGAGAVTAKEFTYTTLYLTQPY